MSKYKLDKSAQIVENPNYTMTQEEVCERLNDLEAKLAESEKNYDLKYKHWIEEIRESDRLRVLLADKDKTIDEINKEFLSAIKDWKQLVEIEKSEKAQFKQQLAEKEKEIENIKDHQKDLCLRCGGLTHMEYEQDKISFAVEQLEKVKEYISSGLAFDIDVQMWFEEYIDNQIEELKKEMK